MSQATEQAAKLAAMLERYKAKQATAAATQAAFSCLQVEQPQVTSLPTIRITQPVQPTLPVPSADARKSNQITLADLNPEQQQAIQLASERKGFCLVGAAGTGKTTTVKMLAQELVQGDLPKLQQSTKYLNSGSPAIAFISYTNRAVKNIARALQDTHSLAAHCLTIHKLLEFGPVWYDVPDMESGGTRKTMRFEPRYTAGNPIKGLELIVVDESSMCDTRLFKQVLDACPDATFIFLGDLNQLKPVFGDAILGFKLLELPVVELTQVYRQAMDSPIISFQHNWTLKGKVPAQTELEAMSCDRLTFQFTKDRESDPLILNKRAANLFYKHWQDGLWNPNTDIILMPFNEGFGTIGLNREIAQLLGKHRQALVHHVISGNFQHYLAVGDRVFYNKGEWEILEINTNGKYFGKYPNVASQYLNRTGKYERGHEPAGLAIATGDFNLEQMLVALEQDAADKTLSASHIITLRSTEEEGLEVSLDSCGDVNSLTFGYATTIHKSQGSEWRKVYLIMTNFHSSMLSRELLYTGMTRAREQLHVIASPASAIGKRDGSLQRAITRQDIPGRTWREKAEAFKGKVGQYTQLMQS